MLPNRYQRHFPRCSRLYSVLISVALVSVPAFSDVSAEEKADLVIVDKQTKTLALMNDGLVLEKFSVVFGGEPAGHKTREGDQRTPEGEYLLDYKKADSAFYKAIHISYPNEQDRQRAKTMGVSPGGQIMIHGQRNGFGWLSSVMQWFNWTDGCIAVTNAEMDRIWALVELGTPILIKRQNP